MNIPRTAHRWQTVLTDSAGVVTTISYQPGCETVQRGSVKTSNFYLEADGETVAILKNTSNYIDLYYVETDHLGSITGLVNESGTEFYTAEFDAWGQRTVTHAGTAVITPGFLPTSSSASNYMPLRGYTGHEHYMECGLIDMNGRMYDPLTARFLSPDPYVQMPDNPQNFNRYAYCLNNPLMYTDPSGEIVWFPIIFGAIMGAYSGYQLGEAKGGNNTFWYMLGGAAIGGISGILGTSAAGSGFMANTVSTMVGSSASSLGMSALSGGYVAPNISFGVASFDFGSKQFNTFSSDNTVLQNIGYGMGTMGNFGDILMLGKDIESILLVTDHDDVGHSAITRGSFNKNNVEWSTDKSGIVSDPDKIISVGPNNNDNRSWFWKKGHNQWDTHAGYENVWTESITVNYNRINNYAELLNKMEASEKLIYSVLLSSCVTHTSVALNLSGVFNVGIHPVILHAQMYLRNIGVRPLLFSYYLNKAYEEF